MLSHKNTLSIECSTAGGSLALFNGNQLLDDWTGNRTRAQSEDFLFEIEKLLIKNGLKNKEIGKVIISTGPGSLTGIRIGMAIGYGLRKSLDCDLIGLSALEGLLSLANNKSQAARMMTAVPIGKTQVCRQSFAINQKNEIVRKFEPELTSIDEFADNLTDGEYFLPISGVILHHKLYEQLENLYFQPKASMIEPIKLIDAGDNLAKLNASRVFAQTDQINNSNLEIIYASNQNFLNSKKQ